MVCRLLGAKPLPEYMLTYCQLDLMECIWKNGISLQIDFNYKNIFIQGNAIKMSSAEWQPFFPGLSREKIVPFLV